MGPVIKATRMVEDAPITVGELITLLSAIDPDLPVCHYYDGLQIVGTNSVAVVQRQFIPDEGQEDVCLPFAVLSGPDGYELREWVLEKIGGTEQ